MEEIPPEIERAYKTSTMEASRPDYSTFIRLFTSVAIQFSKVYILFDAFDECRSEHQWKIVSLISQFTLSHFKIFITSRPHLGLLEELSVNGITLKISASNGDIQKYLSERLETQRHLSKSLKTKIVGKLSRGADGM